MTQRVVPAPLPRRRHSPARAQRRDMRIQDVEGLDAPYYLNYEEFSAGSHSDWHSHSWGHLNYAAHGTMELDLPGARFLTPPQHAIWVPPGVPHSSTLQHAVVYRTIYIAPALCAPLPQAACILRVSPIVKAVLADLAARGVHLPATPADLRLAQVVADELAKAPIEHSYLPAAATPALVQVLAALQADPADHRSVADWAAQVHLTERTLARLCQRELGMALGEWRQRLRFLRAIDALEAGSTVQEIAFDLGYSTASAFIAMFQRESGATPEQYRRQFCGAPQAGRR
ncbi:MAG TPA: helix-turn-helix transcriptional regulator [Pseudorhodoferax sp.]|jgi:AraC-like DNA-binding protein|nr:helix-turn-helix transcriptional regulator [Pseudorhodoferax sp.]